jgi:hypothetical protein
MNTSRFRSMHSHVPSVACAGLLLASATTMTHCRTRNHDHHGGSKPKAEFAPNGVPLDWGRLNAPPDSPASEEAYLANAAAAALNTAASMTDRIEGLPKETRAVDATVGVPVQFFSNDGAGENHPFGDGQKNATLGWAGWPLAETKQPPLLGTLVRMESTGAGAAPMTWQLLVVEPHETIVGPQQAAQPPDAIFGQITNEKGDAFVFPLTRDASSKRYRGILVLQPNGVSIDLSAKDSYPAAISKGPAWLSPMTEPFGWPQLALKLSATQDSWTNPAWPLLFRFPSQKATDATMALPSDERTFNGKLISAPPYAESDTQGPPVERLRRWYDAQPEPQRPTDFFGGLGDPGVHHEFFDGAQKKRTSTGGVDTWVVKQNIGKTQLLFTCFAARDPKSEAQWGVPSGAGWHSIGHALDNQPRSQWTFAETIVNGFEDSGIFAGWGVRAPNPQVRQAPYGANDVATFRVLRQGESFTTSRTHFHWYAVDASRPVCTSIWKHLNCPEGQNGFNDQNLTCSAN